jgi:hypothetical protein
VSATVLDVVAAVELELVVKQDAAALEWFNTSDAVGGVRDRVSKNILRCCFLHICIVYLKIISSYGPATLLYPIPYLLLFPSLSRSGLKKRATRFCFSRLPTR